MDDRLSKGIPCKHIVLVVLPHRSQLIEKWNGYYSSYSLRSISGSEEWKELVISMCPGGWPPWCKKVMDVLLTLTPGFSNIFWQWSTGETFCFEIQYIHTQRNTKKKMISSITIFKVYIFSLFFHPVLIHFLKCCAHNTICISFLLLL